MKRFGKDRPRRLLMGVHPVPTLVTLGNLLCGLGSIMLAMRASHPPREMNLDASACLYWSSLLIFGAMLFDVMDGKVARWTKSASKFGMEMDSLCDVVSFGIAPAILVKVMIDLQLGTETPYWLKDRFIFPLLGVYACCAALRLARYNVESETGHKDFFFGMPSPGAAGCVASLTMLIIPGISPHAPIESLPRLEQFRIAAFQPLMVALPFIMLGLGVLMVSRVLYPHVGDRFLRGRKSFMHLLMLGLILVLFVMQHEIVFAMAFNGYMLLGLLNEIRYQFVPSHRPKEWLAASEPMAPLPTLNDVPKPPIQTPSRAALEAVKEPPAP
ncbi:MAG TPA: CDP-alcohol phosphatidyltransferase family protein [Planctomycetota bacterium]|nr:CDP-alcohol phosphatidyltransferase family protein [Planctomycetota bacterium]